MFPRDSSSKSTGSRGESGGKQCAALALGFFFVGVLGCAVGIASAQTPTTPPADATQQPGQPQGQQPAETPPTAPTAPTEQELQLRQFPVQEPGRVPPTPATPPSTTIPPWTPPVPPPPSQTNVPVPYPRPGAPGAPGAVGGAVPALTVPGAFAPTVTTVRGALLEFHPTARATLEYSDNFFQTTNRSQDNLRSILGPGFLVLLNGARTFGSLTTTVDLIHDTASGTGDTVKVFPSLNAALRYSLTPRFSLTFTDTFVRNDTPTTDEFGLRRGRQTYNTNTAGLSADYVLDQYALQAYYRNVLFLNEDANANSNLQGTNGNDRDSITHILGLNASTRIAIDYLIRAGYEISRTNSSESDGNNNNGNNNGNNGSRDDTTSHTGFLQASRQFGLYTTGGVQTSYSYQTDQNTKIWNGSLFAAYGLPSGISLSGSVGYSLLNSDVEDNAGTVSASVRGSYRFTRAIISLGVFRDFRQTAQSGQDFGTVETTSYFGSFLYQLTPFINATVQVSYNENEPTGTGNVQNNRQETTLTYGASLNWQIVRWLSANLQYSYTRQTGGQSAFNGGAGATGDFAENRVTLGLFSTF